MSFRNIESDVVVNSDCAGPMAKAIQQGFQCRVLHRAYETSYIASSAPKIHFAILRGIIHGIFCSYILVVY